MKGLRRLVLALGVTIAATVLSVSTAMAATNAERSTEAKVAPLEEAATISVTPTNEPSYSAQGIFGWNVTRLWCDHREYPSSVVVLKRDKMWKCAWSYSYNGYRWFWKYY